MISQKKILYSIFSSDNISSEERELIVQSFQKVEFKKNDLLFTEDQTLDRYYFLEKGFVRSFINDYNGNEVTTKFYSEPDIVLDWTSFMLRTQTQENFQACSDCICWELTFNEFQELFNKVEGFRESGRTRFANSYLELKRNWLSMISLTAKERYLLLTERHPEIMQHASLKHIATYLGITDTSLSRIRKEIVK